MGDERVALGPGLNVVTGESGAGKSVLVTALAQLLGAPAADTAIRAPAQAASVEGRLHLPPAALVRMHLGLCMLLGCRRGVTGCVRIWLGCQQLGYVGQEDPLRMVRLLRRGCRRCWGAWACRRGACLSGTMRPLPSCTCAARSCSPPAATGPTAACAASALWLCLPVCGPAEGAVRILE